LADKSIECRPLAHRVISLLRSNHVALVAKQTSRYRKISGTTPSSQRMCSAGTSGEEGNKMRQFGKVDIPQEAFIAALKVDS
jgi:translation elongation factor EF-4